MDINTLQIRAFFASDDDSVFLECPNEQAQESLRVRSYRERKMCGRYDIKIAKRTVDGIRYVVLRKSNPDEGAVNCFKMVDGVLVPVKYDLPKQEIHMPPEVDEKVYLERRIKLMREEGLTEDEIRSYLTEAEIKELEATDET